MCINYFKIRLEGKIEKTTRSRPLGSNEFNKNGYWLESTPQLALIQNVGNNPMLQALPHGNIKTSTGTCTQFVRTSLSVLENIKKAAEHDVPMKTYINLVCDSVTGESQSVLGPRDYKQVKNEHYTVKS